MAYEGSLSATPFPEVLQRIGRSAQTGILTLQGRNEIIGVTFLDGEVVSVDAVNQSPEDGLGNVLEEGALVSRDDFASLVAENQAGGGRVIDLLIERGFVSRQQLLKALRQHTFRLCVEASSWEDGQFRFYRGDQVSYEHGIEPLAVDELLAGLERPRPPARGATPPPIEGSSTTGPAAVSGGAHGADSEEVPEVEVLRLDGPGDELPPIEMPDPPPVEMPDVEYWAEEDDEVEPKRRREPWFRSGVDWASIKAPVLPGRLLGVAMLVSLVALAVLAPERVLVPLQGQERIRTGLASEMRESLFAKVDRAAKTFFLLRGAFPESLDELVALNLLGSGDDRLSDERRLSYTEAPVSYLLTVEGEARLDRTIRTETISGNFLLDPDFSPPELVDVPPLVLLD